MDQRCHISREKSVERLFMVSSVFSALSALGMEFRASGILSTPSPMPRCPPFLFTPSWGFFSIQSWSSLKSWQKESGLWKIEYSGNLRHRILGGINLILWVSGFKVGDYLKITHEKKREREEDRRQEQVDWRLWERKGCCNVAKEGEMKPCSAPRQDSPAEMRTPTCVGGFRDPNKSHLRVSR